MTVRLVDHKDPVGQDHGLDVDWGSPLWSLHPEYAIVLAKFSTFLQQSKNMHVK